MTCLNRSTRNKLGSYLLTYCPQFYRFMKKTNLECCIAQLHNTAVIFSLVFTDWLILKSIQALENHKYAAPQIWRSGSCDCNTYLLWAKLSSLGSNSACFSHI